MFAAKFFCPWAKCFPAPRAGQRRYGLSEKEEDPASAARRTGAGRKTADVVGE